MICVTSLVAGSAHAESSESSEATERAPLDGAERVEALTARLGMRLSQRALEYHDTLSEHAPGRALVYPLRDHHSDHDAALTSRLEFYPGALLRAEDASARVGLVGELDVGLPGDTTYRAVDGARTPLKSEELSWLAGARWRVPLSPRFRLGVTLGYGQHRYTLKGDGGAALVADTRYGYLTPALDARAIFGRFFVEARLADRVIVTSGPFERWFTSVGAHGFDAELSAGYQPVHALAVVAGARLEYFAFNFNPLPLEAKRVAGGVTDRYLSGFLALELHLDGPKPR